LDIDSDPISENSNFMCKDKITMMSIQNFVQQLSERATATTIDVTTEEVKITSIGWDTVLTVTSVSATTSDITNMTIYDESGTAVAGPMDPTYDGPGTSGLVSTGAATTTDTIIVPVGETIYTVKASLSEDFTAGDKIQVRVLPSQVTARGITTDNSITPDPASWVSCNNLTIKTSDLNVSVSTNPAAQTVVLGSQDFTVANYVFDASDSGTDVEVTQVEIPVSCGDQAFPDVLSGYELWDGDNEIEVNNESTAYSTAGSYVGGSATTTLTLSNDALIIPAGSSKVISVIVDIGTGVTIANSNDTVQVGIFSESITAIDENANTVTADITVGQGQAMTLASGGTLNLSALTDPSAALVVAGSSDVAVGKFSLQAKYEDINLNYLGITLSDPSDGGIDATNEYDQIVSLALYEDGVSEAIGSTDIIAANATITPSEELTIPIGETKDYTLKATFANLDDASPAESGAGVIFSVSNLDADGSSAGSSSITINGEDSSFNQFNIFKSLPTITQLPFYYWQWCSNII